MVRWLIKDKVTFVRHNNTLITDYVLLAEGGSGAVASKIQRRY